MQKATTSWGNELFNNGNSFHIRWEKVGDLHHKGEIGQAER